MEHGDKMNIDDAIKAHSAWKLRLNRFAEGTSEEALDENTIGKDNGCDLGKWLYGEGKKTIGNHPAYNELLKEHADFHRQASSVVRLCKSGQNAKVKQALSDPNSDYCKSTTKVIGLLMKLR